MRIAISIFIDLSTFYEGINRDRLEEVAYDLHFPPLILHLAMAAYRGARVLISQGEVAPPLYATQGILAKKLVQQGGVDQPSMARLAGPRPPSEMPNSGDEKLANSGTELCRAKDRKLGSLEVVLDIGKAGIKDLVEGIILQHWTAVSKIIRSGRDLTWLRRTWSVQWSRIQGAHREAHQWTDSGADWLP